VYNEELHNLYSLANIIRVVKQRRMRWVEHVAHMGDMRNAYKILVRKPRYGWANNIRIDLEETA
jgi:hypothetical protein